MVAATAWIVTAAPGDHPRVRRAPRRMALAAARVAALQHRADVVSVAAHAPVPEPKRVPRASGPRAVITATSTAMPATKIASTPA